MISKAITTTVLATFFLTGLGPVPDSYAQGILDLPAPGVMVNKSSFYQPLIFKGILVNVKNPLRFNFLVDKGHDANLSIQDFKNEITRLAKYFLTCLAVPEQDLWVNLSPYEKDRIVPGNFGLTLMGHDLLEEDYLLKQIMASLSYPDRALGRRFWQKVHAQAVKLYGTTDIPITTFNKVWILPKSADVYVHGNSAFVVNSRLDVMMEQDYLALSHHVIPAKAPPLDGAFGNDSINSLSSSIIRDIILPELRKEVNEGKNFAVVRQVYNAMILATWYKRHLRDSFLGVSYVGKNKINGVDIKDKNAKEKIFRQYLKAYKKSVYNYIREDYDPLTRQTVARKYVSGGTVMYFAGFGPSSAYSEQTRAPQGAIGKDLAMATVDVAMVSTKISSLIRRGFLSLFVMGVLGFSASTAQAAVHNPYGREITSVERPYIKQLEKKINFDDVKDLNGQVNPETKDTYDFLTAPIKAHWPKIFDAEKFNWELEAVTVAFQHKYNLEHDDKIEEDGIIGPETRKALLEAPQRPAVGTASTAGSPPLEEERAAEPERKVAPPEAQRPIVSLPATPGSKSPREQVSVGPEEPLPDGDAPADSTVTPLRNGGSIGSVRKLGLLEDGAATFSLPPQLAAFPSNPTIRQTVSPPPSGSETSPVTFSDSFTNVGMFQGGKEETGYVSSLGSITANVPLSKTTTVSLGGFYEFTAFGDWLLGGKSKDHLSVPNLGATGGITRGLGPLDVTAGFTTGAGGSIFGRAKLNAQLSFGENDRFTVGQPEGFVYGVPKNGGMKFVGQLNVSATAKITEDTRASLSFTGWGVPANEGSPDQIIPWLTGTVTYREFSLFYVHIPGISNFERPTSNYLFPNSPLPYSEMIGSSYSGFKVGDHTITPMGFIARDLGFQGSWYGGLSIAWVGSLLGGAPPPPPPDNGMNLATAAPVQTRTETVPSISTSALLPTATTTVSQAASSLNSGSSPLTMGNPSLQIDVELAALLQGPLSNMSSDKVQLTTQGAVGLGVLGINAGTLSDRVQITAKNLGDNAQIAQTNGGIDMNSRFMRLNIMDDMKNGVEMNDSDFSPAAIVGAIPRVSGIIPVTHQMLQHMLGQAVI